MSQTSPANAPTCHHAPPHSHSIENTFPIDCVLSHVRHHFPSSSKDREWKRGREGGREGGRDREDTPRLPMLAGGQLLFTGARWASYRAGGGRGGGGGERESERPLDSTAEGRGEAGGEGREESVRAGTDGTSERRACSRGADTDALCISAVRALLNVIARPAQEALLFRTSSTKTIRRGKGGRACQAGWRAGDGGWGARGRGIMEAEAGSGVGAGKIKWFFARRQMLLTAAGAAVEVLGLLARDVWSVTSRLRARALSLSFFLSLPLPFHSTPPTHTFSKVSALVCLCLARALSRARSLSYMCVCVCVGGVSVPVCLCGAVLSRDVWSVMPRPCVHTHMHIHTHTHIQTRICMHTYTYTHMQRGANVGERDWCHMSCNTMQHARTHARARTHTHIHIQDSANIGERDRHNLAAPLSPTRTR
jgi:hypothetical protein